MSETSAALLRRRVQRELDAGTCSAVAVAWGRGGELRGTLLRGDAGGRPVSAATTRWDLASLTKVLATVPTVLRLVGAGALRLDDRLGAHLPALAAAPAGAATVAQLLAHASGLPAEAVDPGPDPGSGPDGARPLDATALVAAAACELPAPVRYSDVGYLALGALVERLTDRPLAAAFAGEVGAPLGLRGVELGGAAAAVTVPTGAPRRGSPARQQVHDPIARRLGGVGGHAGMFASLDGVVALVRAWLLDERWIAPELRALAWRCQTDGLAGGRRGLGWCLTGDGFHCVRDGWPASAVSHSGFTGTSVVLDPPSGRWCVLLSNLLPRGADASAIVRLRLDVHALVGEGLAR